MIEEINKKFGSIDLILSKAAQANPQLGQVENLAQKETQDTVKELREEQKQADETLEKPETLIKRSLLKSVKKGAASNIKQLLRQTKIEIIAIEKVKKAAKARAL